MMKRIAAALLLGLFAVVPGMAAAGGVIERGCMQSDRPAADRALCRCLQQVADATLAPSHQKRGAAFFTDPHQAQEVKASAHPADDAFWERWELFAETAVKHCQ